MSIALLPNARQQFTAYRQDVAHHNGVESTKHTFAVAPAPAQRILNAYQQSADFLNLINMMFVDEGSGQKIGLHVGTSIAGTTDTRKTPRSPVAAGSLSLDDEYLCTQTNYDLAYYYSLMNAWSHMPDFKKNLQAMVVRAVALDKLCIGFNGLYRALTSDRTANPLLQDVKKGWLQKIREFAPEQNYAGEDDGNGKTVLKVGANSEFKTLDGLVEHAIEEMIAEQYHDTELVAICGRGVLSDKYLPLLNKTQDPTEQLAARTIYANKQLGTIPAMHVPHFPAKTILITHPRNLSIYLQNGTLRRSIVDQPEWDRAVDFQCVNEDFVVEDYTKCALLENIVVGD